MPVFFSQEWNEGAVGLFSEKLGWCQWHGGVNDDVGGVNGVATVES